MSYQLKRILILLVTLSVSLSLQSQVEVIPSISSEVKSGLPDWVSFMFNETPNIRLVDSAYHAYYKDHPFEKDTYTQYFKKWRRSVEPYVGPDGYICKPDIEIERRVEERYLSQRNGTSYPESNNPWRCIGPFETWSAGPGQVPVSWQANIYSLAIAPSDPGTMYAGSEAGGVFVSRDGALSWDFASGNSTITTVHSLAVDPDDPAHVLSGTGTKIYETKDGGVTWNVLFEEQGLGVNDLAFSPDHAGKFYAATRKGLYVSEDSGRSWQKKVNEVCYDLEFKPFDSQVVYLLTGDQSERRCRFLRSLDGGGSFNYSEVGWYFSDHAARSDDGARMTVTPADPEKVYAVLIGNSKPGDNGFIGVYRSDDGADSWTLPQGQIGGPYSDVYPNLMTLNNTNTLYQGYYNLSIAASHDNPDALLIGGLNLWRSTNGAKSYEPLGGYQGNISWIHPDQQEIVAIGDSIWLVNDGGVNLSTDLFETHESRNNGLTGSDYWGMGMGWNHDVIVGGRYHNGNAAMHEFYPEGASLRLGGGEAPTGYVNPGNQIAYFSDIASARIPLQLDGVIEYLPKLSLYPNESYFPAHSGEIEFHPRYFNTLILGRENKLWMSTDAGKQFDLLNEFGSDPGNPILQIELGRPNGEIIYLYQRTSFYGATLWKSEDGGLSWVTLNIPNADSQRAGAISMHPLNTDVLVLSFGHQANDGRKIFITRDGGESWENLSTDMLDGQTIQSVFIHPGSDETIYVGTNYSVYNRTKNDADWIPFWDGLPTRIRVNKFIPFYRDNKLRMATYGNGIWETEFASQSQVYPQMMTSESTIHCIRDTVFFDDYSIRSGNIDRHWSFPGASYVNDSEIRNPKVVYDLPGRYSASLEIITSQGTFIDEVEHIVEVSDGCSLDVIPGLAVSFQDEGDYGSISGLGIETNSFTISAWIYPYGVQPDYSAIVMNDGVSAGFNFVGGDNSLGYHWPGGAWWWNSGLKVPENEWSYVAMVVSPDSMVLYLNGISSKHEVSLDTVILNNLRIASYQGWNGRYFNGMIDELSMWDRSLSKEEIRSLRHLTKIPSRDSGMIAYYQFNEPAGGPSLDRVGVHHMSLYQTTTRLESFAPVGNGVSDHILEFDSAITKFEKSGIVWEKNDADNDLGPWVLTRLDRRPVMSPAKELAFDHFWLVNYYGGNNTFDIPLNLTIDPAGRIYKGEANETWRWNLWQRKIHPDAADTWYDQGSASQVQPGESGAVVFERPENINRDGQFVITRDTFGLTGIKAKVSDKGILLFPNPVQRGQFLNIDCAEGPVRLRIVDISGKEVLVARNKRRVLLTVPSGLYVVEIETSNKLYTSRVMVVD